SADDLVDVTIQFRKVLRGVRRLGDLVHRGLDRLGLALLGDVHDGTDHANRVSGGVVEDVPAIDDRGIRAVVTADSVFRAPHGPPVPAELATAGPDRPPLCRSGWFTPPRPGRLAVSR